jgi:hypothetical protein
MGYTHYWNRYSQHIEKEQFIPFLNDVQKAYKKLPEFSINYCDENENLVICDGGGALNTEPQIDEDGIIFNGCEDNSHETFTFERVISKEDMKRVDKLRFNEIFFFCKTAHKPYDFFVMICLILAKKHFPCEIVVSSDGCIENWKPALQFVKDVCGIRMSFKRLMNENIMYEKVKKLKQIIK